jgi:hypothetical protein
MLNLILTLDKATPMLLLMHQILYKWKPTKWCVCYKMVGRGVCIEVQGWFRHLGRVSYEKVDDLAATTWLADHVLWRNCLKRYRFLLAAS